MALVQQFDSDLTLTLSTLGAASVISVDSSIDGSRLQGFRVTKSRIFITMSGKTTAEGPIALGVALNFESVAAIKAALESDPTGQQSDDDRGKGTFIRMLDTVGLVPTVFPSSDEGTGKMYEISYGKNGWSIPEGRSMRFYAHNLFGSALTTGTQFQITAEHFGVWLRD